MDGGKFLEASHPPETEHCVFSPPERQVGGFVTIASDQPLVGQMLFGFSGAEGITSYSAVPPTVVK